MMSDLVERLRYEAEIGEISQGLHDAAHEAADRIEALESALEPSAETKAAYMGEFSFQISDGYDEAGGDLEREVQVPWTTIKEIMAAIKARATLNRSHGAEK